MNFRDYVKKQNAEQNTKARETKQNTEYTSTSAGKSKEEEVESLINEYAGKSENELMGELLKEVARGKANGSLTNQDIDNFYGQVSGMLSADQKQKLDEIIKVIRD